MATVSEGIEHALSQSREFEIVATHLSALLLSYPPAFVFLHDPETARLTSSVVRSTLQALSTSADPLTIKYACLDAVACFSPRLLFDTALNALANWTPDWQAGATNWQGQSGAEGRRFSDNLDAFVHGLQAISAEVSPKVNGAGKGKGKAKEPPPCRMVLVVERAERLRDTMPELIVPLTRLSELSQVEITTIFISDVQWQGIRPPLRASPEPYYIDFPFLTKQATLDLISASFPSNLSQGCTSRFTEPDVYHPALKPLYAHFIATLYSACGLFTHDPSELAYIAAARWPGFVKPVLDMYYAQVEADDERSSGHEDEEPTVIAPPSEDIRLRLIRLFTPSLTAALDSLYPRLSNANYWARVHAPPADLLSVHPARAPEVLLAHAVANASDLSPNNDGASETGIEALPRMAKFVLIAAFLASTNPARSDLRMFGRGPDERSKRRRRKVGTPRKPKPGTTGTAVKIPQRLLGPTTFPLDRLIAILGVLLEEYDADIRPVAPQYTLPGEYTEMEIARVALYANISELSSMHLLVRTSPPDRLDGTPTFKSGIGYELALKLAKSVGIILNDFVYEVV
ncbi:origin recognition complex subunit 5 C-terminus-domain-containing protein [Daedaleopsis nitida]|nr:origin recognition complex subunit 5 C-terminus-domain-containing protein [Daedaleopsis nitida]